MEWCQPLILILNYDLCVPICYGSSCHKLPRIPQKSEFYKGRWAAWSVSQHRAQVGDWSLIENTLQPSNLPSWAEHYSDLLTSHISQSVRPVLLHLLQLHLQPECFIFHLWKRTSKGESEVRLIKLSQSCRCDCEQPSPNKSWPIPLGYLSNSGISSIWKICKRKFLQGKVWYLHVFLMQDGSL